MNKKLILGILIFALVIGVTFFVRLNNSSYQEDFNEDSYEDEDENEIEYNSNQLPSNQKPPQNAPQNSSTKISLEALSIHSSLESCWVSYKGKVYDITSFLPRHPGSAGAIAPFCGSATEFQEAFTKKHGTSKVSMLMNMGTFIGDFDMVGNLA